MGDPIAGHRLDLSDVVPDEPAHADATGEPAPASAGAETPPHEEVPA